MRRGGYWPTGRRLVWCSTFRSSPNHPRGPAERRTPGARLSLAKPGRHRYAYSRPNAARIRMREWIDWYDTDHSIYVSARHRDVHFRRVATDILEFVPHSEAIVLDYSCGEALHADVIAARVAKLMLAEPAAGVRARLAARYAGNPKIEVRSLDELEALPKNSLDLAVMHSVAQYLTPTELAAALDLLRGLLKPHGQLVLGDIIAPDTIAAVDAAALLRFGLANGFFIAAF